jgi:hypothetical protein
VRGSLGFLNIATGSFAAVGRKSLCGEVFEFGDCVRSRFFCAKIAEPRESRRVLDQKPLIFRNWHPKSFRVIDTNRCASLRCAQSFRPGLTLAECAAKNEMAVGRKLVAKNWGWTRRISTKSCSMKSLSSGAGMGFRATPCSGRALRKLRRSEEVRTRLDRCVDPLTPSRSPHEYMGRGGARSGIRSVALPRPAMTAGGESQGNDEQRGRRWFGHRRGRHRRNAVELDIVDELVDLA